MMSQIQTQGQLAEQRNFKCKFMRYSNSNSGTLATYFNARR